MRENNLNPNNLLQVAGGCFCVVSALLPAETTDTVVSVRATSIPHVESTDTVVSDRAAGILPAETTGIGV